MAARLAQLSLFAVALIIGILLVGQLRSQARPIELSSLSAQELSTLIETLSARNVELSDGLANLREQIRDYERAELQGQSVLELTQENVDGLATFAGLRGVEGQGIAIEIDGSFDPTAVNDLIYELRNAGAEAIAVDDVRITARSVAVLGTGRDRDRRCCPRSLVHDQRHRLAARPALRDRAARWHPDPAPAVDRCRLHRRGAQQPDRPRHATRSDPAGRPVGRVACSAIHPAASDTP